MFVVTCALLSAGTAVAASPPVTRLAFGSSYFLRGVTGSLPGRSASAVGVVVVSGRWQGGTWHVITTTRTDAHGRYRVTVKPRRRGVLSLRVATPDHQLHWFVLRVV